MPAVDQELERGDGEQDHAGQRARDESVHERHDDGQQRRPGEDPPPRQRTGDEEPQVHDQNEERGHEDREVVEDT